MREASHIIEAVRDVIGNEPALLHEPWISGNEYEYIAQAIAKPSAGYWTERFENELAAFVGAKYAIAVCNATCGLHVALKALNLEGTHIRMPSLTFVGTANSVIHAGYQPYFSEDEHTLAVDLLGIPCKPGLLTDSAQSLGAKQTGTRVYSFNQNKIITTGGGGMVVTDDAELAAKLRHLVCTARIKHPWLVEHDQIAFNYRMSDLQAAYGCAQLEQLPLILKAKTALAEQYTSRLKTICGGNNWLVGVYVEKRDECLQALHDAGYMARPLPTPLHKLEPYKNCKRGDMQHTEYLWNNIICLPSSPKLGMRYL